MDSSAIQTNVTVDDFDSILSYAVQSDWQTPDPSSPTFNAGASPWLRGTFHRTQKVDAALSFNFTGPAIYIYGHSGPEYGSYEVKLDSSISTMSAYAPTNASMPHLLYGISNLTYGAHFLAIRNLGARAESDKGGNAFLFDFLQATVQLAPAGATVSNNTIQESDPGLTYQGKWDRNQSPNFSGGGTAYTQGDRASVSLSFNGSAIYVLGDKKNDHGFYNVYLDDGPAVSFSGVSGCGGAFGMTCEQQQPCLKYFASNLNSSEHRLKIENLAGVNNSFFANIVVTVPSVYAPRNLSAPSETSPQPSPSNPGSPGGNNNSALAQHTLTPMFCLIIGGLMLLRSFSHHVW